MAETITADQGAQVAALLGATELMQPAGDGEPGGDESATANRSNDQPAPPAEGSQAQLDEVSKLLADPEKEPKTPPAGGDAAGAGDGDPAGEAPKTLAEFAEVAGLKIEDIYKLDVPMRDGLEPLTLGALKDKAMKAGDLEIASTEIEERRSKYENDMIRSRGELNAIVAMLPEIPPELVAKARDAHIENLQTERQALLDVKPEWADDAVYERAQADILEAVGDYGFTRTDIDLVIDHRLTKLLHDFAGMKTRIAAANAKAKEIRDNKPRGGKRVNEQTRAATGRKAAIENARTGNMGDKVAAVSQLLRGA